MISLHLTVSVCSWDGEGDDYLLLEMVERAATEADDGCAYVEGEAEP
jgi:hypothetical protein